MSKFTFADGIRQAITEEMERDPAVFIIGEDVGASGGVFGVTKGLWERFGSDRLWDSPISEEAIVGAAVGASLVGGRPIAEIMFSDFSMLAMDMIVNQAAKTHYMTGGKLSSPMVVRMVTGTNGSTGAQHSQSLESWFTHVPGLKVLAPSTPEDAKGLMKSAIRDPDPVMFFEHKGLYVGRGGPAGEVVEIDPIPFGSGRIHREGTDVTIVTYLKTREYAMQAAEALAEEGISCEVFDPRTLVPFDYEGLRSSLEKTGRLLVAHEAPARGGFGAEIAAWAAEHCYDVLRSPVQRVGGRNTPVPYAPVLEQFVLPMTNQIAESVRTLLGKPTIQNQNINI
ncbi:alpha-ketoacid dehydrogenase subunit beta [Arthrobacter sp. AK01]|uniref:alpha-ketoacid dehydrogenase subunit beta n=1 Tax=Micrococcaceae TaxID=1268 RepID=UPI001E2CDFDA|nr:MULTISPECIES: alpha-ketoacid dehydrogenase subunit beta [Micrococcaceae]MCD4853427.1 alpha-ketoacid dehydrogenase subunit beta [Arthrobacter sp. AK01]MCP1413769.1 pyruvate dehydrogenase E1 component beta subunit [Paenarthrobacter sp. A20]